MILFVRHAESLSNAGGVTMPHHTIPLSDTGRRQAAALATSLPEPSAVFVSGMARTQQTAAPYCNRYGMTPQKCPELDEFSVIDPALIEGMDGSQRRLFVSNYWDSPDPARRWGVEADTFTEFVQRVQTFTVRLAGLTDGSVIFGHGIWLAMLHWLTQGHQARTAADMVAFQHHRQAFEIPNCAIFEIKRHGSGWQVFNEAAA
jgi:broad specificity phosphatase PhoE